MAYGGYHGGYGQRGYFLPPNNMNNQFLGRECCEITSENFDESLAHGKLTRQEVEGVVQDVNRIGQMNCKKFRTVIICPPLTLAVVITIYVIALSSWQGAGLAFGIIQYVLGLLGTIGFIIWFIYDRTKDATKKIRTYFEKANSDVWHARGIHWLVGYKLHYIQIIMNYNPNGPQPPVMIVARGPGGYLYNPG